MVDQDENETQVDPRRSRLSTMRERLEEYRVRNAAILSRERELEEMERRERESRQKLEQELKRMAAEAVDPQQLLSQVLTLARSMPEKKAIDWAIEWLKAYSQKQ